jgi:asparaginyl-tRNA synthetase
MSDSDSKVEIPLWTIKSVFSKFHRIAGQQIRLLGWVRTLRTQKDVAFIKLFDTSTIEEIQIVSDPSIIPPLMHVHSTIYVEGTVIPSPGREQPIELKASRITLCGDVSHHDPATYPLAKTKLSLVHLRQYPHLRIRSRTFQAIMRISSTLSFATHQFFRKQNIHQVFTPLMTGSDCEGGGEVFNVQTSYKDETPFFSSGQKFLTVSGQLDLESYACGGIGNSYTFGPCFRAEKSSTSRHLAEFSMVEAELIKIDMAQLLHFIEAYVMYGIQTVLEECQDELKVLESFTSPGLIDRLKHIVSVPFDRISYADAVQRLGIPFGTDLSSDQEKELMNMLNDPPRPTFVTHYPKDIKAFYMKPSKNDSRTVDSTDLLMPYGVQEMIGGSIREDDFEKLKAVMESRGMKAEDFKQYLDLRRYGSIPHGGFGVGFSRFVMLCTGMENIRDVTPFPVYYGC